MTDHSQHSGDSDAGNSSLPGSGIPDHERSALASAMLTTPTMAAILASAPPELDDAEALVAAAARLVVDAGCQLSPFGPFLLPPVLLDVALLRTAIGGSYEPAEIPFVVHTAYVAAEQCSMLASEFVSVERPDELDTEAATVSYPEQMRHETVLRVLASAAASEERVAVLERQLVALHEPSTNPATSSTAGGHPGDAEGDAMTPELAQQIFDAMVGQGVDPEDESAVARWVDTFRQLPPGDRAKLLRGDA